eukprot:192791-Alexandrium_andersonii.AAC.1
MNDRARHPHARSAHRGIASIGVARAYLPLHPCGCPRNQTAEQTNRMTDVGPRRSDDPSLINYPSLTSRLWRR